MASIRIGKATLELTASSSNYFDSEFPGEGCWAFKVSDIERSGISGFDYGLKEALSIAAENENDTAGIDVADSVIRLLYALGQKGGTIEATFEGLSAYWAFHDIIHAQKDCSGKEGLPFINVDGWIERRALIEGAILAKENNVPLAEIVREFVKVEPEYKMRFRDEGQEADFLETFLDHTEGRTLYVEG